MAASMSRERTLETNFPILNDLCVLCLCSNENDDDDEQAPAQGSSSTFAFSNGNGSAKEIDEPELEDLTPSQRAEAHKAQGNSLFKAGLYGVSEYLLGQTCIRGF